MIDVFIDLSFSEYYERFPLVLVDVGASGGLSHSWDRARKHLSVIGFEPDDRALAALADSPDSHGVTYLNYALHNRKATVDFHHARKQETSSLLQFNRAFLNRFPEPERFDVLETVQVEADTLDRQLREQQINDVDFIKLDTQGTELFILQGATTVIDDAVFGLEIEVEFAPIYQDQPLFSDVDSFMRELGFQLMDLRPCYWKRAVGLDCEGSKGQLIFADSLYVRKSEEFAERLQRIQDQASKKAKALEALSVCIIYGYLDYAMEILEATEDVFSAGENNRIVDLLQRETASSRRIPNFRGSGRIANLIHKLGCALAPDQGRHRRWATRGRALGNVD